ncbi:hypothetical protein E2C01_079936 [Portunus trituberculatus]|uniref:Uncharacterized protein n=1 Tax=Portunus trituberculatus TaxID=210409 RepID=A0A5B7IS32_PORTR|nr:hypothetical protein [Portunus trituberculatus]
MEALHCRILATSRPARTQRRPWGKSPKLEYCNEVHIGRFLTVKFSRQEYEYSVVPADLGRGG